MQTGRMIVIFAAHHMPVVYNGCSAGKFARRVAEAQWGNRCAISGGSATYPLEKEGSLGKPSTIQQINPSTF